jgi:hypothetical protein
MLESISKYPPIFVGSKEEFRDTLNHIGEIRQETYEFDPQLDQEMQKIVLSCFGNFDVEDFVEQPQSSVSSTTIKNVKESEKDQSGIDI